jgi:hypothetical protein
LGPSFESLNKTISNEKLHDEMILNGAIFSFAANDPRAWQPDGARVAPFQETPRHCQPTGQCELSSILHTQGHDKRVISKLQRILHSRR